MDMAERVLERGPNGTVVRSEIVLLEEAVDDLRCINPCGHVGIKDEYGWMYDFRSCSVCGKGLGTV